MKLAELRRQTKRRIDALPDDEVRTAAEFVEFLAERSGTTAPLTRRLPLTERLRRARSEYESGVGTPVSKLKRKY
jgi:hypothetical protein